MKFHSFQHLALALVASLILAACGGGGASGNPNQGGPISIAPEAGTFYAGVVSTITLSGGRKPYAITSSEPQVLQVPAIVDGFSFDVVPNNPGVIDTGLQPQDLPVRTVTITARDSTGIVVTAAIKVAQNFLTGYQFAFTASTCPGATIIVCPGGQTVLLMNATTNGSLHGLKPFRLEIVRGPIAFVDPLSSDNLVTKLNVSSDHEGKITAVVRGLASSGPSIGVIRVVDVGSGASQEQAFTISGTPASTLSALPATFSFVGPDNTRCGTGVGQFVVFGGTGPFTATTPGNNPGLSVSPATIAAGQPVRFTVSAQDASTCLAAAPVLVQDAFGGSVTVTVTTTKGAAPTPPPAMVVAPNTITLVCGTSGSVSVAAGSGSYSVTSDSPVVTATTSGNTVTITRIGVDPAGGPFPIPMHVSVTDGSTIQVITVTAPATCP